MSATNSHRAVLLLTAFERAVEVAAHEFAKPNDHFKVEELRAQILQECRSEPAPSAVPCVVVPREFIEGIEFGTWRRTDTREGYMCPRCSAFKREGHKPNCSWGGTIKELLSERNGE